MSNENGNLPLNWVKRPSKSKPSKFYYFNTKTGKSTWEFPEPESNIMISLKGDCKKHFENEKESKFVDKNEKSKARKRRIGEVEQVTNSINHGDELKRSNISSKKIKKKLISKRKKQNLKHYISQNVDNLNTATSVESNHCSSIIKKQDVIDDQQLKNTNSADKINSYLKINIKSLENSNSSSKIDQFSNKISIDRSINTNEFDSTLKEFEATTVFDNVTKCSEINPNSSAEEFSSMDIDAEDDSQENHQLDDIYSINKIEVNNVYVVVDTNILLNSTKFLDELSSHRICDKDLVLVIPYISLQELDGLKMSSVSSSNDAQKAIIWCNKHFEQKNFSIHGQSFEHHLDAYTTYHGETPDERIRDCCLLLKKTSYSVCLLSNDVNLRNLSLMANITAYSKEQMMKLMKESSSNINVKSNNKYTLKINSPNENICNTAAPFNNNTSESCSELSNIFSNFSSQEKCGISNSDQLIYIESSIVKIFGEILKVVSIDAYGEDLWQQILINKPPWTAVQVLQCYKKHWIALFSDKFTRDIEELVLQLHKLLEKNHSSKLKELKVIQSKLHYLYKLLSNGPYASYVEANKQMEFIEFENNKCNQYLPELKKLLSYVGLYYSSNLEKLLNKDISSKSDVMSSIKDMRNSSIKLGYSILNFLDDPSNLDSLHGEFGKHLNHMSSTNPILKKSQWKNLISDQSKLVLKQFVGQLEAFVQYIDCHVIP